MSSTQERPAIASARVTRRRLTLAVLVTLAIVSVFIVRLVDLQVVRAAELNAASHGKRAVQVVTNAPRGSILDRNGVVLADSVVRYDITVSPRHTNAFKRTNAEGDREDVTVLDAMMEIAEITGADVDAMMRTVAKDPDSDFAYLVRSVGVEQFRAIRELKIPWVYPRAIPKRTYPNGSVAGNIVGFVGTDGPQNGIEAIQDSCLASIDGVSTYEQGADGVRLPGSTVTKTEPVPGGDITLTIDSDLQFFVQQALAQQALAIGAESGMATVVRVKDGHIMAVGDYPSVDPNYVDGTDVAFLGSRAFTYTFEPGSIMKAMSAAMLVDEGRAGPSTKLTVPYRWHTPDGSVVRDAFGHADMNLTLPGILAVSSNVGIAMLAAEQSSSLRYDYFSKFGFGTRTAIGFQGEEPGQLDSRWNAQQRYDVSYGQGITVTSVQMASAFQALANGGVRLPLTLVESCTTPDGTVERPDAGEPVRVVSAKAAATTLDMLQSVVTDGVLSSRLSIPGYQVAAKTGTGEVAVGGVYTSDRIVSVAGVAPADNPEYVVVVTFVKPVTMKTSSAAAPVFRDIMAQVLKTYRVPLSTGEVPNLPTTW